MKHIMILEEDRKLNRRLHDALIQDGFTFSRCGSIDEAWEVLRSQNVDLILSGRSPGGANMIEFVQELRTALNMPFMVIAQSAEEAEIDELIEAGADDYITGRFTTMTLRARVASQLRFGSSRSAASNRTDSSLTSTTGDILQTARNWNSTAPSR
ncbi:MAG: response regulator [Anaerovoracaceae bacterium]